MAKVTFDGDNKIINVVSGVLELDVKVDLYSDWKEWVVNPSSSNAQYLPALRTVGGDPLGGSRFLGDVYFLMNGWKIRPQEADHELTFIGNLYLDSTESGSLVVPTVGNYTVLAAVERSADARAVLVDQASLVRATKALQYIIETKGGKTHAATGDVFYFDPVAGDDTLDGTTPLFNADRPTEGPVATLTKALSLCDPGDHDVIQVVQTIEGYTHYENIVLDKPSIQIRGPGRQFRLHALDETLPVISIEASSIGLQGFSVGPAVSGSANLIEIANSCRDIQLAGLDLEAAQNHGLVVGNGCAYLKISDCDIHWGNGDGIRIGNSRAIIIENSQIHSNDGNGITIDVSASTNMMPELRNCNIHGNAGYGIVLPETVKRTSFFHCAIFENTLGDISGSGSTTYVDQEQIADTVWSTQTSSYPIPGTMGYQQGQIGATSISASVTVDVSSIVSGVWDANAIAFNSLNTMGAAQNKLFVISSSLETLSSSLATVESNVSSLTASMVSVSSSLTTIQNSITFISTSVQNVTIATGSITAIVNAVWDEATSLHTQTGSFGVSIQNLFSGSVTQIVSGVWDTNNGAHLLTGSTGLNLSNIIAKATELHQLFGLEFGSTVTITPTSRTVTGISQSFIGDPLVSITVNRL